MSALRPLPARPNLEFEHKEAKALLRRLRSGDPEAIERASARHPDIDVSSPANVKLADAQLVIAREYGFASWPKLVRYFGDVERQRHNRRQVHFGYPYDDSVKALLARHRNRRGLAGRSLAAYVPRFYGMPLEDIFASTVTEDDARLAVARSNGFASWELLQEYNRKPDTHGEDTWTVDPERPLHDAMQAGNLPEVQRILAEHPDLLNPSPFHLTTGRYAMAMALHLEQSDGHGRVRPIIDWLETQGWSAQRELNYSLCGRPYMKPEDVAYLIERGADPNWIAPNGYSVIEHAILRYWNGDAVDVLGRHCVPPRKLWVAAGSGDVDKVRPFLDRNGKPTEEARRHRPDFDAISQMPMPAHPEADDEEILTETLFIAMLNGRSNVIEFLVSRGANINSLVYESPLINIAVGNAMTRMVECLIRCGADLDLKGTMQNQSAREMARDMLFNARPRERYLQIARLCGHDPDAILAERGGPPDFNDDLKRALQLAGDDAVRLGQTVVDPLNLFFGLLRGSRIALYMATRVSRMDVEQFHADYGDRIAHAHDRVEHDPLPLDADAQALVDAAVTMATENRHAKVSAEHLLFVLVRDGHGVVSELIARYSGDVAALREGVARGL